MNELKEEYENRIILSNKIINGNVKLSLLESKLIFIILSKINIFDISKNKRIRIFNKELKDKKQDRLYDDYKRISKGLLSKIIEIEREIGDYNENTLQLPFFRKIIHYKNKGYFDCFLDYELLPYLVELKQSFTILDLRVILSCRSKYSIKLYTLLKQYTQMGYRIISVKELKEKLGIEQSRYNPYGNFKSKVLLKCIKEINTYSNLKIKITHIKEGRRVVSLRFDIQVDKQLKLFDMDIQKLKDNQEIIDIKIDKEQEEERKYRELEGNMKKYFLSLTEEKQTMLLEDFYIKTKKETPFLIKYFDKEQDVFKNTILIGSFVKFLENKG